MTRVVEAGVVFGLGSDIGAGTTPSLFNAMSDAYKVQQVLGTSLSPFHLWYLATLGGAAALSLDRLPEVWNGERKPTSSSWTSTEVRCWLDGRPTPPPSRISLPV